MSRLSSVLSCFYLFLSLQAFSNDINFCTSSECSVREMHAHVKVISWVTEGLEKVYGDWVLKTTSIQGRYSSKKNCLDKHPSGGWSDNETEYSYQKFCQQEITEMAISNFSSLGDPIQVSVFELGFEGSSEKRFFESKELAMKFFKDLERQVGMAGALKDPLIKISHQTVFPRK